MLADPGWSETHVAYNFVQYIHQILVFNMIPMTTVFVTA